MRELRIRTWILILAAAFSPAVLASNDYAHANVMVAAPKSDVAMPETYAELAELVSIWQSFSQEILKETSPDSKANAAAAKVRSLLQQPWSAGGMLHFLDVKGLAEKDPSPEHMAMLKDFQSAVSPEETLAGLEELVPAIQALQASAARSGYPKRDSDQRSAAEQRQRAMDAFAAFNERAADTRLRAIIRVRE